MKLAPALLAGLLVPVAVVAGPSNNAPPRDPESGAAVGSDAVVGKAAARGGGDYDAIVDAVVQRYRLPGIAVGVIRDGEVVYTRTSGETIAGTGQPITQDTLFKIASNSKAMTASVLARLVDAGKLRWDDPVTRHLPQFRMHDPWVTRNMQVRDLLIHNSGLPEGAGDLMLWPEPNAFQRSDIVAGLAHLKPERSFRSGYAYDNLLYVVAGEVAAAAGGAPYEALVRREVFQPLGLKRCHVGRIDRGQVGDIAQPHMRDGDGNVAIRADERVVPVLTSAAAGGIRCSLGDMLTWARAWISPTPAQRDWLSQEQRKAMWTAQMPMPISRRRHDWDDSHFYAYGYGWRLSDIHGAWSVSHTGTLAGMYSVLHLLPETRSGFVVLINGSGDAARTVLNQVLVEELIAAGNGRPGAGRTVQQVAAALAAEPVSAASVAPDTSDRSPAEPAELGARLGRYLDPWFGEVTICRRAEQVEFAAARSPMLAGTVMRAGERYLVDWYEDSVDAEAWLDFAAGRPRNARDRAPADAPALTMAKVDPDADFSYDFEDLAFNRAGACRE
ncbi:MAG: serine hydrolase [Pseudomonadota bacterium]|nr:serine hydrolase [Pseudomonadota bacterium]